MAEVCGAAATGGEVVVEGEGEAGAFVAEDALLVFGFSPVTAGSGSGRGVVEGVAAMAPAGQVVFQAPVVCGAGGSGGGAFDDDKVINLPVP
ncbi:hypothetical protein [Streptomyces roseoverticillatus]|uniref:hypothetical protein n=1 Tax=Streptomyces roseoverticillatus TaxID=66429 RepID=UPI001F2042BA|nr:hypothetical protein [Streptomyces roseoverticillatus]